MNIISFSRLYISYLLFNVGGWVYFGYLLYYTSYINTENCNSYTKELTDAIKIFVGISMALTTMNIAVATSIIMNSDVNDTFVVENLYCIFITSFISLSISGIISLVIFGITSGMTDIQCSNNNADFGLKLSVYGVIWIAFIEMLLIFTSIILFIYNIIENAKLHLLCMPCFNVFKKYNERRIGIEPSISKYDTSHIKIPMPVATYNEEPKLLCSVCYDHDITLLLEPCNHICICQICYNSLVNKQCPICSTKISATRKIYFASPNPIPNTILNEITNQP
jgi:hypothetical protein